MYLGKAIRLGRLFNDRSGRLLAITLDHAIARGVLPGLVDVESAVASVAAGQPDAITLQKGIAARVFSPDYAAGGISLIVKATSYSPFHPTFDTPTATVEEALRLGADAISVGMLVGEPNQAQQLTHLSSVAREAEALGLPLAAHIYPRGEGLKGDLKSAENVQYAVRAGAEVGVDVIKTEYTGSAETFAEVVLAASPA
jgi:class I fructose-bisphosphate aldolase